MCSREPTRRQACGLFSGIMVAGFLARLLSLIFEPTLSRDAITYLQAAGEWAAGEQIFIIWQKLDATPLFFLFLVRLGILLGIKPESAGIALNLTVGMANVWLIYRIARFCRFDRAGSLIAALLFSLAPSAIAASTDSLRESLYLFLISAAFVFCCRNLGKESLWNYFLSGVFASMAVWTRFEAWALLPVLMAGYCFSWGQEPRRPFTVLLRLGILIASFGLGSVVLLWAMGGNWDMLSLYWARIEKSFTRWF